MNSDPRKSIDLADHLLDGIKRIEFLDDIPSDILDEDDLLVRDIGSIAIHIADEVVGRREVYLCYSTLQRLLFVVETEKTTVKQSRYRPQYGANDNYDEWTQASRLVWIYTIASARAQDPKVKHVLSKFTKS